MQSVSELFNTISQRDIRELNWACRMAFDKTLDDDIDFFTIGTSLIGGGDFIKPAASEVVQEWDKYIYTDFTDRILDIQIERKVEKLDSLTLAMADIILDNHDDYFTPGAGSAIDGDILPYRPIRLYLGFGDEVIPMFIGITEKMPEINDKDKTVKFHCIDFLYSLLNRSLDESALYEDQRTDQILQGLFVQAGLDALQLDFDEGLNTISFAYFGKGEKLGDAIRKVLQPEQGRLYMDEYGVIKFRIRTNYNNTIQKTFNAYDHIKEFETRKQDEIINVVEVNGKKREEQPKQKYWELQSSIEIPAGQSVEVWANFDDPITSIDAPSEASVATTSLFTVNSAADGSGTPNTTDVTLSDSDTFAKSYKMTFTNGGASTLYITSIELYCTPAVVVQEIYDRRQDDDSVDAYDERILQIDNEFIQSSSDASSLALVILGDYANFGKLSQVNVKGTPALQIDDLVRINLFDNIKDYRIRRIIDQMSFPAQYKQIIDLKEEPDYTYFTIGSSLIGGTDVIRP